MKEGNLLEKEIKLMEIMKLILAATLVISPVWLIWKVVGKDGLEFFFVYFGVIAAIWVILVVAHWAIEFVLVKLGFDKEKINTKRSSRSFIFWRW